MNIKRMYMGLLPLLFIAALIVFVSQNQNKELISSQDTETKTEEPRKTAKWNTDWVNQQKNLSYNRSYKERSMNAAQAFIERMKQEYNISVKIQKQNDGIYQTVIMTSGPFIFKALQEIILLVDKSESCIKNNNNTCIIIIQDSKFTKEFEKLIKVQ